MLTRVLTLVSASNVRSLAPTRVTLAVNLRGASAFLNTDTKRTHARKVIMIDVLCILLFTLWWFYGDDE